MPKIVIFGGTCEGRLLAETFQGTDMELHICVATEYGASLLPVCENIHVHAGRMDREEMEDLLSALQADCCLDATHPYAVAVTENISEACRNMKLPYIRVLRREVSMQDRADRQAKIVFRESIGEAVQYLSGTKGNILITTGSRDLEAYTKLAGYRERCFARVLPTLPVMEKCKALGFEGRNLIGMQGPFSEELNLAMLKQVKASWLVTKNSGKEGGYPEKCEAAIRAGANLVVIGRPAEHAKNGMELEEAAAYLRKMCAGAEKTHTGTKEQLSVEAEREAEMRPSSKEQPGAETPLGGRQALTTGRRQVYLIGVGPGRQDLLTQEAKNCLAQCDVLIGAKRMLEICPGCTNKAFYVSYRKEEICAFLREHAEYRKAAVVYSGDIGFYSGARGMQELLAEFEVHPVSGISSPLYFLNRLGLPWEDVRLVSCHGQKGNLFGEICLNRRVCALLGERTTVSGICRELLEYGMDRVKVTVGERLSYSGERITSGFPAEMTGQEFDTLSVALFENPKPLTERISPGLGDDAFIREKVPMTKEEIRILSLAKLHLLRDSVVYDVGAGTGSVSVEAALLCTQGRVYAVEKKPEAAALLWKNKKKFAAYAMEIVEGCAPECLGALETPTHVFIGGSGGRLTEIVRAVRKKNEKARFVINAVTLETISRLGELREEFPEYADMEVVQVGVARSRELSGYHLMSAENPVFIISFGG